MDIHRKPDGENNYEKNEKIGALLSAIAESNCLSILALSQSAYNIQVAMLDEYPLLPIQSKQDAYRSSAAATVSGCGN